MSIMEDITRSVRVTYVYNGRQIFTEAVKLTSPQRESKYDQMSDVHLSREGDRLTKAMRFTSTHRESEAHPTNQMHGEAHQY